MATLDAPPPGPRPAPSPQPPTPGSGWRSRIANKERLRKAAALTPAMMAQDRAENDASRLPDTASVQLGGIILTEIFTPSTVSALRKAFKGLPTSRQKKDELISQLDRSRSSAGLGGSVSLMFSSNIASIGPDEFHDPTLPPEVDIAWINVAYPIASLAVVVAIFVPKDSAADLSELMRTDFSTENKCQITVPGLLGPLRARIPWDRPEHASLSTQVIFAEMGKRQAYESRVSEYQFACSRWMAARFPGRFSAEELVDRPKARLLITKEILPFKDYSPVLKAIGLEFGPNIWKTKQPTGWSLRWPDDTGDTRFSFTAAAYCANTEIAYGTGVDTDNPLVLAQQFLDEQSNLVTFWAIDCLMSVYADRLAALRDNLAVARRFSMPVRQARVLDKYLIGDGLDASSIISDLKPITINADVLRRDTIEYDESLSGFPDDFLAGRRPRELIPTVVASLKLWHEQVAHESEATTENMRASAELRQAIANTRLQRAVIVLSILALAVALVSLFHSSDASKPGSGHSQPRHAIVRSRSDNHLRRQRT